MKLGLPVLALAACLAAPGTRLHATAPLPAGTPPATAAPAAVTFERDIRPILRAHCTHCHGEEPELAGHLDVRQVRLLAKGGDSGPAIVAGKKDASLLFERVTAGEMPPGKKKLSADELARLGAWLDAGAPTARPEPAAPPAPGDLWPEDLEHWSLQAVRRPPVPKVRQAAAVRTPIDAFLLAKLEAVGASFSPEADRRTLIRRLTFDLLGLPPAPEEVEAFVADQRPDAYERLVDRLLASPHYGERWGRHWLDVVGYADSEGYNDADAVRSDAYRYRDYVIRAFNADKPWNEFLVEQLAGDELVAPPYANLPPEGLDRLVATGYLRMAPDGTAAGGPEIELARNAVVADTLRIVSTSLLGLTVGCAQCHDHRYDPISQADYYRLRAVFEPAFDCQKWRTPAQRAVSLLTDADRQRGQEIEAEAKAIEAKRIARLNELLAKTLEAQLAKVPDAQRAEVRKAVDTPLAMRTPEQKRLLADYPFTNVNAGTLYLYDRAAADELQKLADEAAAIRAKKPVEQFVRALTEVPGRAAPTYFLFRGDPTARRQEMTPGELRAIATLTRTEIAPDDAKLPTTGRRLAYARALTAPDHPLVGRVLVNRFWMHHMGRGIVETPGDFGKLGAAPSHPELLDWLAREFVDGGWRLKPLHRLIVTSTAYRQQSTRRAELDAIDPDNRLLGRMNVRRIEAEAVRDAVLFAAGTLNPKAFGPPVPVTVDEVGQVVVGVDTRDTAGRPSGKSVDIGDEAYRRSVYVQVRRTLPLGMLESFDAPTMEPNCECRNVSTVAPQALWLMNNEFVAEQALRFAERVAREASADPTARVDRAWMLAYGRMPTDAERRAAVEFLAAAPSVATPPAAPAASGKPAGATQPPPPSPELQALAGLCQVLLAANEFVYVD